MNEIRVDTFRQLLEGGYRLSCWCPGCRRDAACDLAELVRHGLGDRASSRCRPRCRICGSEGRWTVHPPGPTAPDFTRLWM